MNKKILVSLISLFLFSCAEKKKENLVLEVVTDEFNLVDATDRKCGSDTNDLLAQYIKTTLFNLRWKGDRYLFIQTIRTELKGSDLSADYTSTLSDDEIFAMYSVPELSFAPSASGEGTETNTFLANSCAFKAGGIKVKAGSAGVLTGKIIFKGYTSKTDAGEGAESFSFEKDITVTYSP